MKQYIEKIALARKKSNVVDLEVIQKIAGVPRIKSSDVVIKKWEDQLKMTDNVLEVLPYWDWAIENNYLLPSILRIDSIDIIRIEAQKRNKNIPTKQAYDILKHIVSPDELRPAMNGVFHKGGFMFATDGHVLLKTRQPYFFENEGVVKRPDVLFETINERYPDVENAIPQASEDSSLNMEVDLIDLYSKLYWSMTVSKNIHFDMHGLCYIKIFENSFFSLYTLNRALIALLSLGVYFARFNQSAINKALVIESIDKCHLALIMPVYIGEEKKVHFNTKLQSVEIESLQNV